MPLPNETETETESEREQRNKDRGREIEYEERRLKFRLALGIVSVSFVYLLGTSVAEGFGITLALPPWQYWAPFIIAAIGVVFGLDLRDWIGRK